MSADAPEKRPYEAHFDTSHLQSGLKKRAIRGAGFSITAQMSDYAIQTIGTIVLARLLIPADFGLITMVAAFSLLIQNFGLNGFTEVVIQRKDITHQEMSKLFWLNFAIMLACTLAFIALSPLIAWFYKEPQLKTISVVMSLTILFGGLTTCHLALLNRSMKFHVLLIIQSSASLLSTGIAIVAAVKGIGYWALVLRRVTWPLMTALFAWLLCRWRPALPERKTNITPMVVFGLRTYGNFLMDYFRKNLDKILIGKVYGKSSLGFYDRAYHFSQILPNQLTTALSNVGFAALSRLRDDTKTYLDSFGKSLSLLAFVAFPGSVILTLIGKDIIVLLLGTPWTRAGEIFAAFGPAVGLVVIYNTNNWLHVSLGRADRLLKWSIVAFIASVAAYIVGMMFGPLGVAVAYSALFYVLFIPALWYAGRPIKIPVSYYLSILWKYWTAAFIAGLIFWALFNLVSPLAMFYHQLNPFVRVGLGFVFYGALYSCFILILFKGPRPFYMLRTISRNIVS